MKPFELHLGDCLEVLKTLPDNSIDAVVCDPPYELGFMGKGWDASGIAYSVPMWTEALRVLKPGGHLLAFSGSRTYHRMTCAIEDAGFDIRDQIMWVYGSGFPKSLDVSKAIDKAAGAEREDADWSARNGNNHPTVKPVDLMAYLCRLITPPGGTVLDPFMGSGSTGKACMREGFHFIGIEREAEYHAIALARITHEHDEVTKAAEVANAPTPQLDLFADMGAA